MSIKDTTEGRFVGYMRVSTDEQEFALQRDALIKHGVPEDRIFSDKMSGAQMNRAGLKRAIKVCWPGDTLVVWKLDRLGRSTIGVLEQIKALDDAGINIVSVTERLDTKSPMGKFTMTILAAFAQMERDMISERTAAGIAAKKKADPTFRMGQLHPILDRPKRRAKFKALYDAGAIFHMTGGQIVQA
jgi:DNA invertase Pin-like site-specific DNA recombinase